MSALAKYCGCPATSASVSFPPISLMFSRPDLSWQPEEVNSFFAADIWLTVPRKKSDSLCWRLNCYPLIFGPTPFRNASSRVRASG